MKFSIVSTFVKISLAASSLLLPVSAMAQEASSGYSKDLDFYQSPYSVSVPPGKTTADIRAVGIAGSNDHIYVWYDNNTVSSGTSSDLDAYHPPQAFAPPPGRSAETLMAAGIASNDHIYYYWADGKVSRGTSQDADAYASPATVSFPSGFSAQDLRGVGIAGSNNHVYAWFGDGSVSEGSSQDLDAHAGPKIYNLPGGYGTEDLAGVGIAGSNDRVYAWYHASSFGNGWSTLKAKVDTLVEQFMADNGLPGMTVSVSKAHRMVLNKGYGSADLVTGTPMEPHHRARIGSVSKVITALAVMKHAENVDVQQGDWDLDLLDRPIYGSNGLLPSSQHPTLIADLLIGHRRYTPVVGSAIWKTNDTVYTYYDNNTFSTGTTSDLDKYSAGTAYSLPPGKSARDIRGMATDNTLRMYTWYRDGSLSIGTTSDLDAHNFMDDAVTLPTGQSFDDLVGIGMAGSNNVVYAWFENGLKSSGTVTHLALFSENQPYDTTVGKTPYDIRSMAIAKNDRIYTFYGNNTVTSGNSWDLDRYLDLYSTSWAAGISPEPWLNWYGDMTLRHLLSHTSGFIRDSSASGGAEMFGGPIKTLGYENLHRYTLRARPLSYAPGTASVYSNHGMGLAGWVLEEASGVPYKQFIDSELLGPLGISMGRIWEPLGFGDARNHLIQSGTAVPCVCAPSMEFGEQRGGLTSTAGDLVRLMLATDQHQGHPDILAGNTLNAMETTPFPAIPWRVLGWRNTNGKLSHNGKISGGQAEIAKYPSRFTINGTDVGNINVAVVTNSSGDVSLTSLVNDIAEAAGQTPISSFYDIY